MSNDRNLKLAWAAGFIDGEGSIRIDKTATSYYLKLELTQKAEMPVRELEKLLGGIVSTYWHGKNGCNYFRWRIESIRCADVLRELLPYLVLKKKEAQVAIAFSEIQGSYKHPDKPKLYAKMKELKVRV